ncbi:hypothetical protein P7K49_032892 [Saguinus oedipus]|uniref:Uncharacterized protein n=1 Tax=Saguinus oedipus TaxID=9490 RepID=A0ABQ9TR26_SAGOE|nr:hypothetical protein P7K49_032892 [Saguinus oedipus]
MCVPPTECGVWKKQTEEGDLPGNPRFTSVFPSGLAGVEQCMTCAGDVADAPPCSVGNYLRWDLSAQQIEERARELIEQTKRVYDQVGAQAFEDVSYESTLKALADVEVTYTGRSSPAHRARSEPGTKCHQHLPLSTGQCHLPPGWPQWQNRWLGGGVWQGLVTGAVEERRFRQGPALPHSLIRSEDSSGVLSERPT